MLRAKTALLLFLVMSLCGIPLLAAENPEGACCDVPGRVPSPARELGKLGAALAGEKRELDWWAASREQIRLAPCSRKTPLSDAEIEQGLRALVPKDDPRVSRNIHGIQIENESAYLVDLLDTLLTYKGIAGIIPGGPGDGIQRKFTSSCKTVLCAVNDPRVFGPKLGPRLLYLLARYGFNGSPYSTFSASQWTPAQIDEVLLTLSDFPPAVFPIDKSYQLVHYARGRKIGYAGVRDRDTRVADSSIFVYDLWDGEEPEFRRSALLHELGHHLHDTYGLQDTDRWRSFSGWRTRMKIEGGVTWDEGKMGRPEVAVSQYGLTNPSEDFAESVVAYRYNPGLLRSLSPDKYSFIKEAVFDGLEYSSEAACDPRNSLSARLTAQGTQRVQAMAADPARVQQLSARVNQHCSRQIFSDYLKDFRFDDSPQGALSKCLSRSVSAEALKGSRDLESLRFKEENTSAVLGRVRIPASAPGLEAIRGRVISEFQEFIADQLVAANRSRIWDNLTQKIRPRSPEEFCGGFASHAFVTLIQDSQEKYAPNFYGEGDILSPLRELARNVCVELQGQRLDRFIQPSAAQIREAVRRTVK